MEIIDLNKNRSITSCLTAGYAQWTKNMWGVLKSIKWYILFTAIVLSITINSLITSSWHILFPMAITSTIAVYQLNHQAFKYIANAPSNNKRILLLFKHLPRYISYSLLTNTISFSINILISTPLIILIYCYVQNQVGILQGDPDTQTTAFTALFFVTSFFTCILILCMNTWRIFSAAFLYGACTVQDIVKFQNKKNHQGYNN